MTKEDFDKMLQEAAAEAKTLPEGTKERGETLTLVQASGLLEDIIAALPPIIAKHNFPRDYVMLTMGALFLEFMANQATAPLVIILKSPFGGVKMFTNTKQTPVVGEQAPLTEEDMKKTMENIFTQVQPKEKV